MDDRVVAGWFDGVARRRVDAIALRGVGGQSLSYAALNRQVGEAGNALNAWGIGAGDVVLIALNDGPAALWAFLAVSRVATAFPVPAHEQPEEFARIIAASKPKAVLMEDRPHASLAGLARSSGLILIHVVGADEAGRTGFRLAAECRTTGQAGAEPTAQDTAVLTLTSGTSAVPKIVASTHASLLTSIRHVAAWLGLSERDRALCVMPFVHLHSLVRTTFPVMHAGGEVVWAPGFDREKFLGWIEAYDPTYVTAVPSIYRMVVEEADRRCWERDPRLSLRLMGVGSDRVQPSDVENLRRVFGATVFQFYGLTETCPFIAMTPLGDDDPPPEAAGRINPVWQVRFVDEAGIDVPAGSEGEIVVRGGIVNRVAGDGAHHRPTLTGDWFHTRDLGRIDERGFLYVTGRIGDRIVRGGKKIEPLAVEQAIAGHPAVRRAVAFGLADPVLGQRVAAVVELNPDHDATPDDLLAFAAGRLPAFMVPEELFLVDLIPTTGRGKISRAALSAEFGHLAGRNGAQGGRIGEAAPAHIEDVVLNVFRRFLGDQSFGVDMDFFRDGGGDSLAALSAMVELEKLIGVSIPPADFQRARSARSLARLVDGQVRGGASASDLVPVQPAGSRPPLFLAHGVDGRNSFAAALSASLGDDQPVFTFHASRVHADAEARTLQAMARRYATMMAGALPAGPYCLAGHSFGARLAFEIAREIHALGGRVSFLGLIDSDAHLDQRLFGVAAKRPSPDFVYATHLWAARSDPPRPYAGCIVLFRATDNLAAHRSDATMGWDYLADGGVDIVDLPGDHHSIVEGDGLLGWADLLRSRLVRAQAEGLHGMPGARPRRDEARDCVIDALSAGRRGAAQEEILLYEQATAITAELPFWVYGNHAEALFDQGRFPDALAAFRRSVALDPSPLTSLARFAPILKRHRLTAEIAAVAAAVSATEADHVSLALLKGKALVALGNPAGGEDAFVHGLRLDPENLRLLVAYGGFLLNRGRYGEVLSYADRAIGKNPNRGFTHTLRGKALAGMNRPAEAEEAFRQGIAINPSSWEAHMALSKLLLGLGRLHDGEAARRNAVAIRGGGE